MKANVLDVYTGDWMVEGEWIVDVQTYDLLVFVLVDTPHGTFAHNRTFKLPDWHNGDDTYDSREDVQRLIDRITAKGEVDLDHWYFHDFFSRSLEDRLNNEALLEDCVRKGTIPSDELPRYYGGV